LTKGKREKGKGKREKGKGKREKGKGKREKGKGKREKFWWSAPEKANPFFGFKNLLFPFP